MLKVKKTKKETKNQKYYNKIQKVKKGKERERERERDTDPKHY